MKKKRFSVEQIVAIIEMAAVKFKELRGEPAIHRSAEVRERVVRARQIQ